MRKIFLLIFSIVFVACLFKTNTKSTCAYNIDTCGGLGTDGQTHTSDTICYYSSTDSPYFTSDASSACKRAGCPGLPATMTCDDLIQQDPNRGHNEHAIEVDTTGPGGANCLSAFSAGAPYKCCAKVTALPTVVMGTQNNPCPDGSCQTAFGTVNVRNPASFISTLFSILLSISGVIALLLIITSGYQLSLSQGNPEKVKNAREKLTAAIIGLLFIIFSVAILQIIGVDILHLPGFSH